MEKILKNRSAALFNGNFEEADKHYRRALELTPGDANVWHLSGVLAYTRGDLSDARRKVERALKLAPENFEALNTLGSILRDQEEFESAADAYAHAIESGGESGQVFANRGELYRRSGNLDIAEVDCRKAVNLNPNLAAAHGNLAAVLMDCKDWIRAEQALRRAILLTPKEVIFSINLSKILVELNRADEALYFAKTAIDLSSGSVDALNALGNAHYALLDYSSAEIFYRKALTVAPKDPDLHNNLGNTLARQNQLDEAEKYFNLSLLISAERPSTLTNLGGILQAQGRLEEALEIFEEALRIDPDYVDGHWNRGLARLLTGDLSGGFKDYEWRFRLTEFEVRQGDIPVWEGEPLAGKSILIYSEQGYGDTIQFVRYIPMLADQGAEIFLETQKPLVRLLEGMDSVREVFVRGAKLIKTDFQLPVMSLPNRFATTLDQIPASVPYLRLRPSCVVGVGSESHTLIGIAWAGNPRHKNSWAANRSLEAAYLKPLFDVQDISWVSLQVDDRHIEAVAIGNMKNLHDVRNKISDFADTAGIIANLDLVITVDTAVAHLAGALGKPVWVLLAFAADWRWLLDRDDSPWYPTMRLFRQKKSGDWESVIASVAEALRDMD